MTTKIVVSLSSVRPALAFDRLRRSFRRFRGGLLWLAASLPAFAVTLSTGDLLVSDEGTSAANSGVVQVVPSTGARTFVTGNGVGSGAALDVPRLVVAGTNGMVYYWETFAGGTDDHIIALNPVTGARSTVPGGAYATLRSLCWDASTGTLLVADVGTTSANSGIVRVNPATGARTFVTGNGVGGGAALDVPRYVTCAPNGTIYYFETGSAAATFRQIISVNPATGVRTVVPGGTFPTVNVADGDYASALAWDPSTSTLLVIDEGTTASNSGIVRVNVGTGTRTFVTGNGVGSGAAIDVPRFLVCSSSGQIYYQERTAAATHRQLISVNPANGARTAVPGGAYSTLNGLGIVPVPPPSVTSSLTASGTYGSAITTYTITGSNSPTSFSTSGLPSGLSVNTANGQITGTPTASGAFNVTIGVANASGSATAVLVFTIAKKNLTVSGVTAANKTYNGNTSATLGFGSASLVGVVGGDTVTLATGSASGSFADKAVGTGKTVTVSGLALAGASSANYTLTQPTTTANITAAGLTVSGVSASNKTYDGGTSATLGFGSASLVGVVGGDTVTLATGSASGSFADKNVGTGKTVIISGLTLSGIDGGNYSLTQPTTTADITAAGLTVSGVTAPNKTYNGNTSAMLNLGSASLVGVVGGDTVTLATGSASGSFADKNVGTGKTVIISGLTLGGIDGGNYSLTQPTTTANITAAGLTVNGVTANNKTYDATSSATLSLGSASLVGVIGGDNVTLATASATGAFADKNVGVGKTVTISGLALAGTDSGNYTLTQPSDTADIAAATLTVSADDKTRAYGFANPTLTATITGFAGGETAGTVLTGAPELATAAGAASAPGDYAITAVLGTLSAANANYTFGFVDGILTVRLLSLADWEEENFLPEDLGDPMIAGPDADPDFDGVTNLYEYAFGTDPNDITSGPGGLVYSGTLEGGGTLVETGQPVAYLQTVDGKLVTRLLFVRQNPVFAGDLSYTAQFSSNGTTWVSSFAAPTVLAEDGLYQVVSVPYPLSTGGKKTRFHRVAVDQL